jgi:hypothetical protein
MFAIPFMAKGASNIMSGTGIAHTLGEAVSGKDRAFRDAAQNGDLGTVQRLVGKGQVRTKFPPPRGSDLTTAVLLSRLMHRILRAKAITALLLYTRLLLPAIFRL